MSPSEVITELYIMPEDAAFGAFSFSLKTLFFHYKWGKMSSSLSHFEAAGLARIPGPATAVPTGPGVSGGGRRDWKGQPQRRACCLPLAVARPSTPGLAPEASLSYSRFSILTKALYRIVLITFRC